VAGVVQERDHVPRVIQMVQAPDSMVVSLCSRNRGIIWRQFSAPFDPILLAMIPFTLCALVAVLSSLAAVNSERVRT
jgi:hypothetical protein